MQIFKIQSDKVESDGYGFEYHSFNSKLSKWFWAFYLVRTQPDVFYGKLTCIENVLKSKRVFFNVQSIIKCYTHYHISTLLEIGDLLLISSYAFVLWGKTFTL